MIEKTQRGNLGRGLAALFGEEEEGVVELDQRRSAKDVPIEQIHPNANQPRRHFTEDALEELSESIRSNGVLQPILVRDHGERPGEYEIVAGERRWRAAQRAQLHQVPVVIREIDDGQALELALVENLQREDLTALEEADAYHHLMETFDYTQEALAKDLGKSRSHIANTLRLRALPDAVKALLEEGELSAGHARALLSADEPETLARGPRPGRPNRCPNRAWKRTRTLSPSNGIFRTCWASRSRSTFKMKAGHSPSATRRSSSSTTFYAASIRPLIPL
jgi:ParB family chromosome partitioning protein